MFNGQILRQLIADAGLTKKEFEKQMFGSKSTDLYHLEKAKNLRSDTLERLRDVLKCSMDDLFTAPSWASSGTGAVVGSNNVMSTVAIGTASLESQYLKELILEKDKRISTLENYIKLLESKENRD